MKVILSSEGTSLESRLDPRFGRCTYFIVYDSSARSFKAIKNSGAESNQGAGIAAANQAMEEGVEAVITGNLGPNAYSLLQKAKVHLYKSDAVTVKRALELLEKEELSLLEGAGRAHQGML